MKVEGSRVSGGLVNQICYSELGQDSRPQIEPSSVTNHDNMT